MVAMPFWRLRRNRYEIESIVNSEFDSELSKSIFGNIVYNYL